MALEAHHCDPFKEADFRALGACGTIEKFTLGGKMATDATLVKTLRL